MVGGARREDRSREDRSQKLRRNVATLTEARLNQANQVIVGGARRTPDVRTADATRGSVARSSFGQYGVARIDLSKVQSSTVDLTQGIPGLPRHYMLSRWSIKTQEVLVQDLIAPEAIRVLP